MSPVVLRSLHRTQFRGKAKRTLATRLAAYLRPKDS